MTKNRRHSRGSADLLAACGLLLMMIPMVMVVTRKSVSTTHEIRLTVSSCGTNCRYYAFDGEDTFELSLAQYLKAQTKKPITICRTERMVFLEEITTGRCVEKETR